MQNTQQGNSIGTGPDNNESYKLDGPENTRLKRCRLVYHMVRTNHKQARNTVHHPLDRDLATSLAVQS